MSVTTQTQIRSLMNKHSSYIFGVVIIVYMYPVIFSKSQAFTQYRSSSDPDIQHFQHRNRFDLCVLCK